jgi:predicted metal-dependent hydrolase
MADRRVIAAIPVEVRRNKRRRTRIGLAFDPAGYVIMEAPLDASEADITTVIHEHHRWLRYRLDKALDSTALSACLRYHSGDVLHYFGDPYELVVREGARDEVRICRRRSRQLSLFDGDPVRGEIRVTLGPYQQRSCAGLGRRRSDRVRGLLNQWYVERATEGFAAHLEYFRRRLPWLGGRTPEWRHRFMRSQWGSCSLSGRISLNTHLIKIPPRLIEYVVLHELCHLQHHDHGRRFYALMTRHMPDWQVRRTELDRYLPVLMQD